MSDLNDHGHFCTWSYAVPSKKPRGFWHGDNPLDQVQWAYAFRSECGAYWHKSEGRSGFATEESAIAAAQDEWAEAHDPSPAEARLAERTFE